VQIGGICEVFFVFIELEVKYPKLGLLGPSFTKTGDEMRSQDGKKANRGK
jgi:hypothetical protein